MKINMEVDDVAVSIAVAPDGDDPGRIVSEVIDVLIEPALLALGYHHESIRDAFASYKRVNDDEGKDEVWDAGFSQGYDDGVSDGKNGRE
jgi:hypothetical protein